MKWKLELDALIESTMAFAKDIKRGQPIADLPVAKRTAEQALADTSTPIPLPRPTPRFTLTSSTLNLQPSTRSSSVSGWLWGFYLSRRSLGAG